MDKIITIILDAENGTSELKTKGFAGKACKVASKAYPDLLVTTCHQYEIHVPFHYQCLNPE